MGNISEVTFINHDLKNFIGAAYCHLQLLEVEHPEFVDDSDIKCAIQNLRRAVELSNDIARNIKSHTKNESTTLYSNKIIININLNRHLEEKTKPIHEQLRKRTNLVINDTYKDNGKGMMQDELDKIILSSHGDGVINGLGAQSIYKIAEEIGFHVSYTSVEGEGTTVRIVYPYVNV